MIDLMSVLSIIGYSYVFIGTIVCISALIKVGKLQQYESFVRLMTTIFVVILLSTCWPYFWKTAYDKSNRMSSE